MESHDEKVRRAFGRPYSNEEIEQSIHDALGCRLPAAGSVLHGRIKEQTYENVMETVDYSKKDARNLFFRRRTPGYSIYLSDWLHS